MDTVDIGNDNSLSQPSAVNAWRQAEPLNWNWTQILSFSVFLWLFMYDYVRMYLERMFCQML